MKWKRYVALSPVGNELILKSSDGPYEEDTADSDADPQTAVPDTESSDEELLFGMSRAEWANADPVADMESVRKAAWNKIRDL